jgi:predicted dehydrogenase
VQVGVVGAGSWGINHVRVLAREPRVEHLVVVDPDRTKWSQVREVAPTAQVTASLQELLDSSVDAVIIAAPAATHVELAVAVLEAGKHVLVEKPLARTVVEAKRVAATARAAQRVAMVGHLMVFHPAVRRIRELLRSGSLGAPYYLHGTRVNLGRLRTDETALWCFGPHDLSMIDFILEKRPISVSSVGQAVLQPGVEDVVFVTMRFATGELAHLHLSWLHPRKERRLTLVCSKKMVEFDDVSPDKLRIYDRGYDRPPTFKQFAEFLTIRDGDVYLPKLPMEEPLALELRHFLDCIETGREPDTSIESGIFVTATLAAAQRSLEAGGAPLPVEI